VLRHGLKVGQSVALKQSRLDGSGWVSGRTLWFFTIETHDAERDDTVSEEGDTRKAEGVSKVSDGGVGGGGTAPDWHKCIFLGLLPECDEWPGLLSGMMRPPGTLIWARR
jgi:hypothetical protein